MSIPQVRDTNHSFLDAGLFVKSLRLSCLVIKECKIKIKSSLIDCSLKNGLNVPSQMLNYLGARFQYDTK